MGPSRLIGTAAILVAGLRAPASVAATRPWSNGELAQPAAWHERMNGALLSSESDALTVTVAPGKTWAIAGMRDVAIPPCGGLRVTVPQVGGGGRWLVRLWGDMDGTGRKRTVGVFQSETRTGAVSMPLDPRLFGSDASPPLMLQLGLEGPERAWATFAAVEFLPPPLPVSTAEQPGQITIDAVRWMPNLPEPFEMLDWKQKARDYDALAFDWEARGQFLPLIWEDDSRVNIGGPMFGLPSYAGDPRASGTNHESITTMGALLGATLVGIDKSGPGRDYVDMALGYHNTANGQGLVLNRIDTRTGGSFWYEIFPHIVFYSLTDRYPDNDRLAVTMASTARRWGQAVDGLDGDFDHLSFDFATMRGADNGRWTEPDSAAGIAWLQFAAYKHVGDRAFLRRADRCMTFLHGRRANPYYEALLPWGALAAARMNAELGRAYDVRKMVDWCFGISDCRGGWGVVLGRWGVYDCAGLVGSVDNRGGYAFAMNTFSQAAALTPVVRYDPRFARAIGKWMLNLANAARLFYPDQLPRDHQSCAWWRGDPKACIAYEGLRYEWDGKRPFATGDPVAMGWGPKTNRGLYGSSYVGLLGAMVTATQDDRILALDCLATDAFHPPAFPTYLVYNPYPEPRQVALTCGPQACDAYDAVSGRWLARGQVERASFTLAADVAAVVVFVPSGGSVTTDGTRLMVDGVVVDWARTQAPE